MKRSFVLNYLIGFAFIGLAVLLSAQDPALFFNLTGLLIVVGGSVAALLASYPVKEIKRAGKMAKALLDEAPIDEVQEVEEIVQFARLWSRNDIRAMEKRLEATPNKFLYTGIQMLIAKVPLTDVTSTLGWRIKRLKVREQADARVFHSLASFAPAFGMLGTLIGLVNMMLVMESKSTEALGFNWAVALVTTFYGLLLANLVFKPVATKLERRTEKRLLLMTMVLEGINLMGMRRGPAFIRENLLSFITQYDNELADSIPASNHNGHTADQAMGMNTR